MAPLANDPRQLLTVLNLARRKALYTLVVEITAYMRSQLEFNELQRISDVAPLLIDPSAENSIVIPEGAADTTPPSPALVRLRAAAIEHFDAWRKDVLAKFKELLSTPDDATIVEERRKRIAQQKQQQPQQPQKAGSSRGTAGNEADLLGSWDAWPEDGNNTRFTKPAEAETEDPAQAIARLQSHWHAIPTRLVTIPEEDRRETLSCVLLVLLSTGHYSAHARAMAVYLASALELPLAVLNSEEAEIAMSLVERSNQAVNAQQQTMSAQAEAEKRKQQNQSSRYWKVGLASVAGAALIGVTGGLAAPVVAGAIGGIMGSVGLGGVASFLGIFWMNGALVGTLFGAFGARMTGEMVDRYAREVEDFRFIPLKDEWGSRGSRDNDRRLRVTIGINGWLNSRDDVTKPWRALGDDSEAFALRYEMSSLLGLGKSLQELVSSYAWNTIKLEILKRTVLATLWSALWPAYLLSMASAVDNPFSLAKNRSEKAGEILADALINKVQGERPVTLIGYSLGARVIYSCLRSLAARKAFGLVDTVVFIGAPVPSNRQHWQMIRTVVSGKMFNVYSENDYLLAFLYRATSIQLGVAGLQEIKDTEGVENLNLSDEVQGHMRYAKLIAKILAKCGVPVIKGSEGPIEQDEDTIQLSNQDTANLIDLDELGIVGPPKKSQTAPPPVHTSPAQPQLPMTQLKKQRTAVTRTARSAVPVNQDLLGLDLSETPSPNPGSALKPCPRAPQPHTRPQRAPSPPGPAPAEQPKTIPTTPKAVDRSLHADAPPRPTVSPIPRPSAPKSQIPAPQTPAWPVLTSPHSHRAEDDEEDSDEEGGMGIKMVDNDDGLEYCDPTPMEDEYPSWN
ncbi:DUF726-domain-containing protein [Parathielavia appendiculata]|uniref:DUF726-domain-containing protein n=1 Tax=Parathielavia appendiculata TaxID=2587402 RepID=A0AAN6Z8Q9_9PEZI|nr:DUF726-domain-containing protein [Parathielavia appendiculata]